ncbi:MAG: transcriptional repressor, partial [Bacteroidetes bacterium]|nr:transcriptional repressor [Bacteroidota bacterium]
IGHKDLEDAIDDHDRVTLYRILTQFEESGVIHKVLDNSGVTKYALCNDECETGHHEDEHLHFECEKCGKTYCIEGVEIPQPSMPGTFKPRDYYLLVKGDCGKCY